MKHFRHIKDLSEVSYSRNRLVATFYRFLVTIAKTFSVAGNLGNLILWNTSDLRPTAFVKGSQGSHDMYNQRLLQEVSKQS